MLFFQIFQNYDFLKVLQLLQIFSLKMWTLYILLSILDEEDYDYDVDLGDSSDTITSFIG